HVTHNEAVRMLDALVHASVETMNADTPPPGPAPGTRVIIGTSPNGIFSGKTGQLAAFQDAAWAFYTPQIGWVVWAQDAAALYVFDGTGWTTTGGNTGGPPATLGVNATADAINRLTVASQASLFNHEGAGHRLKVNKADETDTASVLFQNNFSGRAELGLTGSDAFQLRTSADGSNWTTQLSISPDHKRLEAPGFITGQFEVSPNEVATIIPPRPSGFLFIVHGGDHNYPQILHSGIFLFDVGPSRMLRSVYLGDQMRNKGTALLTGTAGPSGGTNVAVQDGEIQVELRAFSHRQPYTYAFVS
ncbi:MAG: DUF2793 domain-containing protein, partial [Parvularculaceae bacterium]